MKVLLHGCPLGMTMLGLTSVHAEEGSGEAVNFFGDMPVVLTVPRLPQNRLDGVFMDVRMPEVDGIRATRLWRAEERNSGEHLPIIALTANDSKEDRQACLAAGMDDFLVKPVNAAEVAAVFQRYCYGD